MKAIIKATGKIVEVEEYHKYLESGWEYRDNAGTLYKPSALDFSDEAVIDYWTRLEHQYAGQFMQAMISSSNYIDVSEEAMADASFRMAHALVEKLKEKEERK